MKIYRLWEYETIRKFPGYVTPGIKRVKIYVEIQNIKIFQDMEIILDMENIFDTEA